MTEVGVAPPGPAPNAKAGPDDVIRAVGVASPGSAPSRGEGVAWIGRRRDGRGVSRSLPPDVAGAGPAPSVGGARRGRARARGRAGMSGSESGAGLELLFRWASPGLARPHDALLCFVHWELVTHRYRCLGAGDQAGPEEEESELLPAGWNADPDLFTLRYRRAADHRDPAAAPRELLLKAVPVDGTLILNAMECNSQQVVSLTLNVADYVDEEHLQDFHRYLGGGGPPPSPSPPVGLRGAPRKRVGWGWDWGEVPGRENPTELRPTSDPPGAGGVERIPGPQSGSGAGPVAAKEAMVSGGSPVIRRPQARGSIVSGLHGTPVGPTPGTDTHPALDTGRWAHTQRSDRFIAEATVLARWRKTFPVPGTGRAVGNAKLKGAKTT
uniref:Proteasome inhibitor PI31 subunit n=1 Tax=Ornithorhynchus anatinus TaxID=9258 RepID=A0A6I8NFI6_ORNAN